MIERIQENLLHEDKYLRIFRDDVSFPSGAKGKHWRIAEPNDGAVAIVMDQHGKIYLHDIYRYVVGKSMLETIRGFGSKGEDHTKSALREFEEEKTFEVEGIDCRKIGQFYANSSYIQAKINVFLVKVNVTKDGVSSQSAEEGIRKGAWFSKDEISAKISSGEIEDGITLAALAMLASSL